MYYEKKSKSEINWKRNMVFVAFGFGYLGCFQYILYTRVYYFMFPKYDMPDTIKRVLFDQFIKHPIFFFPVFYSLKEFINQSTINKQLFKNALLKYKENAISDCMALWYVFVCVTKKNTQLIASVHFVCMCVLPAICKRTKHILKTKNNKKHQKKGKYGFQHNVLRLVCCLHIGDYRG